MLGWRESTFECPPGCLGPVWGGWVGDGRAPLGAWVRFGVLGEGWGATLGAWVRFGVLGQHPWVPGCWGLIWGAE